MKCTGCQRKNNFRLDPQTATADNSAIIWGRCMHCGHEFGITTAQAIKLIEDFMEFQNTIAAFSKALDAFKQ